MSNEYVFLEKASNEPDLQDVVGYLKKPLHLLQELDHSYHRLDAKEQSSIENHSFKNQLDNIVQKYLPGLIEEYCKLSFSYRNTSTIKNEHGKSYTAKQLLLKNIAKVSEEAIMLQEKFNEHNQFNFLVHDKLALNLGFSPQITGNTQPALSLANQFDYQNFIESNGDIFKKTEEKLDINDSNPDSLGFFMWEILIVIAFMVLALVVIIITYPLAAQQQNLKLSTLQVDQVQHAIESMNSNHPINNDLLKKSGYLPESFSFDNAYKGHVYVYTKDNRHIIKTTHISQETCELMQKKTDFEKVIVSNSKCMDNNTVQFILRENK